MLWMLFVLVPSFLLWDGSGLLKSTSYSNISQRHVGVEFRTTLLQDLSKVYASDSQKDLQLRAPKFSPEVEVDILPIAK